MDSSHPIVERMSANEKLEMIRTGERRRSLTGVKQFKNITYDDKGGKFRVVEKQKKYEESGVTRKKRNHIEFMSKLGFETQRDFTKIAGPKVKAPIQERKEEKIVQKKKKIEYLDNYQYKETKHFGNNPKPARVVHRRLGDILEGSFEEISTQRYSANVRPANLSLNKPSNLKSKIKLPGEKTITATKSMTSITKVGRRGGAGGPTSTTTKTTTNKSTTRTTRRGAK